MKRILLATLICSACAGRAPAGESDAGFVDAGDLDLDAGVDAGIEEPFDAGCVIAAAVPPQECTPSPEGETCDELTARIFEPARAVIDAAKDGCVADSDCTTVRADLRCDAEPRYLFGSCVSSVRKDAACSYYDAIAAVSQAACDACRADMCISVPGCLPERPVMCRDGRCGFADL